MKRKRQTVDRKLKEHLSESGARTEFTKNLMTSFPRMAQDIGDLKELLPAMKQLTKDVEAFGVVTVINGNEMPITYNRKDFFQFLYDRPRNTIAKATSFADHTYRMTRFLMFLGGALYFISELVANAKHLIH